MRKITTTSKFRQDLEKTATSRFAKTIKKDLTYILELLKYDEKIPEKYRDHALIGNWYGFRDLHIKPELVLIYSKPSKEEIKLVRIGTHAQLKLK